MSAKDPKYLIEKPAMTWMELTESRFGRSMDGYKEVCCFSAAYDLGLFDILTESKTLAQVSDELGTDSKLLEPFLEILVGTELLEKDGDMYRCSEPAGQYFAKSGPYYQDVHTRSMMNRLRKWSEIGDNLMKRWSENKHEIDYVPWITSIGQNAMSGDIQDMLAAVRETMDISKCRTLLDIGGGHGLYSIAFGAAYPGLHCTVFDQPPVTPVTKENAELYGADLDVQTGDYYKDAIEGKYDIVFASYNMACIDPALVHVIADLLNDGGYLIIRHSVLEKSRPFEFIEWNNFPDREDRKRPEFSEYIKEAEEHGLAQLFSKRLAGRTEMVVFQKGSS